MRVTADLESQLVISLTAEGVDAAKPIEIPLRSLVHQSHNTALDDSGNHMLVARSPADRLRVRFDRDHLVFAPGETFQFEVEPYLVESNSNKVRLQARIVGAPGGQQMFAEEYDAGGGRNRVDRPQGT